MGAGQEGGDPATHPGLVVMIGLSKDQRVSVPIPRSRLRARGVIIEVFVKSYLVQLDSGHRQRYSAAKVKSESTRRPTAKLGPIPGLVINEIRNSSVFMVDLRPAPKPELPEPCPAWLKFVKKFPCCNCGTPFAIEAHHEGKKDAAFQKVRDTLAVPLCAYDHKIYTDKYRLPNPYAADVNGPNGLRSREESLEILRAEQERLLNLVLAQLEPRDRIEILSRGIAQLRRPGALAPLLGRIGEAA
jgi:hypothetical protein